MVPSGSVLVLVKLQVSAVQLEVKLATGGWFAALTVTLRALAVVAPVLWVAVRITVDLPGSPYAGVACTVDRAIVPSGSVLVLEKLQVIPLQLDVKLATGYWFVVLVAALRTSPVASQVPGLAWSNNQVHCGSTDPGLARTEYRASAFSVASPMFSNGSILVKPAGGSTPAGGRAIVTP